MDNDIRYCLKAQSVAEWTLRILREDGAVRQLSQKQISQNIRYALKHLDAPYKLVSREQAQEILKNIPLPHTAPRTPIWQKLTRKFLDGLFLIIMYTLYTVGSEIISFCIGYLYGRFAPQLIDTPLFYASIVAIAAITFYLCAKLAYYKKQLITFRIFYIFLLLGCVLRIILGCELPITEGLMFVAILVIALLYEQKFKERKQNSLTAEHLQGASSSKVDDTISDIVVPQETSFADDSQSDCNFSKIDVTPAANTNMMPKETKTHHIAQSNNANRFLILLSTLLCIALVGILIWSIPLMSKLKTANASLEASKQELTLVRTSLNAANAEKIKLSTEISDLKKESADWKSKYETARDLHLQIIPELTFYRDYAFIVPQGSDYYHTYECVSDNLEYFIICNSANAKRMGFSPHSCIE